uniref:Uncharacterized protein n=1 Tax=viral metagenome TaxID=1070528 RepID=A0A6C0BP03_9ZZZZ
MDHSTLRESLEGLSDCRRQLELDSTSDGRE